MRQPTTRSVCAALAVGLAFSAGAVDWQFTGATNRTFAASCAGTFAEEFNSNVPGSRQSAFEGDFDSRIPNAAVSGGHNLRSDTAGTFIIFR